MQQHATPTAPLSLTMRLAALAGDIERLRPAVDRHVTVARVERYLTAIADMPAPSTAASAMRGPVLRTLLQDDGALGDRLSLDCNFANTGSTVLMAGRARVTKPLWYFAHLDTISYLMIPSDGERQALVPFCYHLTANGVREALCYRFDLDTARYVAIARGLLESEASQPFFRSLDPGFRAQSGDRVVPVARCAPSADGHWTGHFDNSGGVAALAVAAPIIAEAGLEAMLAFPDEEEGPIGSGNQVIGRGGSRIINRLDPPDLAVIVDMQQSGEGAAVPGEQGNSVRLGLGAVLSEFSSLGRGAVTPPHLFALARRMVSVVGEQKVRIQEPRNSYTSRSDDVSVMLKTPNILLLGFPGLDRHFDSGPPKANVGDIVDLAKALVYTALLQPIARAMADLGGSGA